MPIRNPSASLTLNLTTRSIRVRRGIKNRTHCLSRTTARRPPPRRAPYPASARRTPPRASRPRPQPHLPRHRRSNDAWTTSVRPRCRLERRVKPGTTVDTPRAAAAGPPPPLRASQNPRAARRLLVPHRRRLVPKRPKHQARRDGRLPGHDQAASLEPPVVIAPRRRPDPPSVTPRRPRRSARYVRGEPCRDVVR